MKMKREASPIKNKPNPIAHMMAWGFGSGIILGTLFAFWILNQDTPDAPTVIPFPLLLWFASLLLGFMFGGSSGVVLGALSGMTLSRLMRDVLVPFTWEDMQAYRTKVYFYVGLVTILLSSLPILILMSLIFWAASTSEIAAIPYVYYASIIVPFIAGAAAIYAAHRYLFRLRLWSEEEYGLRREKVKNVEALEDKVKVDEMDFDEVESKKHETS